MTPQAEALLRAGHAVHLGVIGSPPWPEEAVRLWDDPRFSVGHAVVRSDGWRRLAESKSLPDGMRGSLPADPGILAYLNQLDLDLLLLGAAEADYLIASRRLGVPTMAIAASTEAVLAQAEPRAVAAPPADPFAAVSLPGLWMLRGWDALTSSTGDRAADGERRAASLGERIGEGYARNVFPVLAGAVASLAPARRPLLKLDLDGRLQGGDLANEISAEGIMAAAAEGRGPVILGPWWGEPELELLYWTPFLRWWRRRYQVDKDRIVAVSDGGAAAWYENLLGQYHDLSELFEPALLTELQQRRSEELAARNKRFVVTAADRQIVKRLDRRLGFRGLNVLSPWVMAVAFDRYWKGEAGPALFAGRTRPQPLRIKEKLARRVFPGLPPAYVAFGASEGQPASLEAVLRRIAERSRVVLLAEAGATAWAQGLVASNPRIHAIGLEPGSAKGVASTVLAAARAYVGPRGWMACAASALGRPAICLGEPPAERQLIDQASAARLFAPSPVFLSLDDAEAVSEALELIAAAPAPGEPAH